MKTRHFLFILVIMSFICISISAVADESSGKIKLPKPSTKGKLSFEQCTSQRRSVRKYTDKAVTIAQLSQLLWAAQGITNDRGFRTVPSAGALFPIEIYTVVSNVDDLKDGVYHYNTKDHSIIRIIDGDKSKELSSAALGQGSVLNAPVNIVITGVIERSAKKYKDRATQYTFIEAGAICQNIYLQCESLGLGTVVVGAFYDDKLIDLLEVDKDEYTPLLIMPVGNV